MWEARGPAQSASKQRTRKVMGHEVARRHGMGSVRRYTHQPDGPRVRTQPARNQRWDALATRTGRETWACLTQAQPAGRSAQCCCCGPLAAASPSCTQLWSRVDLGARESCDECVDEGWP